jgi:hypothetical protein
VGGAARLKCLVGTPDRTARTRQGRPGDRTFSLLGLPLSGSRTRTHPEPRRAWPGACAARRGSSRVGAPPRFWPRRRATSPQPGRRPATEVRTARRSVVRRTRGSRGSPDVRHACGPPSPGRRVRGQTTVIEARVLFANHRSPPLTSLSRDPTRGRRRAVGDPLAQLADWGRRVVVGPVQTIVLTFRC